MDFVRSNFGTNEPLPVEHFFPHFLAGFLRTHNKPAKSEEKSVQLAEVHLYRIYFLQNPYFSSNYRKLRLNEFDSINGS
jgi:hypothetical protein